MSDHLLMALYRRDFDGAIVWFINPYMGWRLTESELRKRFEDGKQISELNELHN